ncbi:PKD domain-containing protein [Neolewinella maritima]|uniref:PKD domain-containing protein n=1 Tax=Neolewinella maritima TaxID=1383882 RepID=UPI001EE79A0F|nr:PKD domain-containing protein [Neolewinella maritima]
MEIQFKIYNNGDPGTYKVTFPDGSDTIYTQVTNTVSVIKEFMFDCGSPPGKPLPPKPGALFYEYQSALDITRLDCVDDRGDNQRGSYDFRVVPNPIVDIKTSDLTCIEAPFTVNFEGKMCSEKLVESYQWYMDGVKLDGEVTKFLKGFEFEGPGTHVAKLEVSTFKGCDKYIYEKPFQIFPTPTIDLSYDLDTAELCNPNLQIITNSTYQYAETFSWTSTSPGVTFSDPTIANPVINIENSRAGIRTIIVNIANAYCSDVADTIRITTLRGQTIQAQENIVTCTEYTLDLCDNLQYLPTPDNIEWTSDKPGVHFDDVTATCPFIRFDTLGEYVLTATGSDVCGEVFEIPINVRVRDGSALEIDISAVDTVCVTEDPIALLDYIQPNYKVREIYGPGVGDNIFNPSLVEGDVEVTVVDSCGAIYPLNFHVIPQEFYEGTDVVLCEGETIDLFALQAADYRGEGVADNIFDSGKVGIGSYKIRFFSRTFCGGEDSLTVTVQEFPRAAFDIVTDSCSGPSAGDVPIYAGLSEINIENRSSARALCYEILETGQKACSREKAKFKVQQAGTYTLQQVVAFPNGQCNDTLRKTFRVQLPPVIDFAYSMDSTVCDSLSINLTLGDQPADMAYNWSFSNFQTSQEATPLVELIRPLAPEVFGVNASLTNACYTTEDTFGIVLPLRFRVSFDFLNDNNTVCSDDTIFLSNTSVNADNFLVTYPDGRAGTELPEFLILRNEAEDVLRYPVTLRGSNQSCPDQTAVDTMYVLPITTEAAFGLNYDDVCSSAEVVLDNSSTPGALTFVYWGDESTPQFIDELESLTHYYDVTKDTAYTIEIVAQLCGIDTFRHDITVRPTPDASYTVLAAEANCVDLDMLFTPNNDPNAFAIDWSFGDQGESQESSPSYAYERPGSYMTYCEVTSSNGCSAIDSFQVDIGEYNGAAMDFEMPTTTCSNTPFLMDLRAPLTGWSFDYGNGLVGDAPIEIPYFDLGDYVVNLEVTSANGCSIDSNVIVTVFPSFEAEIQTTATDTIVDLGDMLNLSVNIYPARNITEIVWSGDSIVNPNAAYTLAQPINDGLYEVALLDEHGCSATDSIRVRVDKNYEDRIYAPNVFSPNGDGHNETFGLEVKDNTVAGIQSMRIMSRNGAMVYECHDCSTGSINNGWDGRLGGKLLESSVYIWAAEIDFVDGTSQVFTGDVTLLR